MGRREPKTENQFELSDVTRWVARYGFIRFTFVACALVFAPVLSFAQDATQIASDAEKQLATIQKLLAKGQDASGKDNPLLKQLRVDSLQAVDDKVQVGGVFIDPGAKPNGDVESQIGDSVKELILKHLGINNPVAFGWKQVKRVGVVDEKGEPVGEVAPHIILQNAANAAGAKGNALADHVRFDGSHFGEDGSLVITGVRAKEGEIEKLVNDSLPNLDKHTAKGKAKVSADLKSVEWKASATAIQKAFATAGSEKEKNRFALRRLVVERAYFAYDSASLIFRVEGFRIGDVGLEETALDEVLEPIIADAVGKKLPLNKKNILTDALDEPLKEIRAAVFDAASLDGVRIDSGFTFGSEGELQLAGIQPELTDTGKKELERLVQSRFLTYSKNKPLAAKYERVGKLPVSVKVMTALPLRQVMTDLRKWAVRGKDDLKLQRLYFPSDPDTLKTKHFVSVEGLVLLHKLSNLADAKDVEAEFKRLMKLHIAAGIPGATPLKDSGTDKEAPMPSLTAFLRKEMAGDQKKWNGVFIERGYFDENGLYTLRGVVESSEQAEQLAKRLDGLKAETKWEDYLTPKFNPPELTVISMTELVSRVQRVMPSYTTFDGIRIVSAHYDADTNLIFDAGVVGNMDREAAPLLAKLISEHPTYSRRVPVGKQVKIVALPGSDKLPEGFDLASGSVLIGKAGASKENKQKAKDWLDVARLHHPTESSVWFLSAYYNNTIEKDKELTRRDLFRVVELEKPGGNGPTQRKRRYEAVKDLQGESRNQLEKLWLDCFDEAKKDGVKPLKLK